VEGGVEEWILHTSNSPTPQSSYIVMYL
jgi:hypothetical protein